MINGSLTLSCDIYIEAEDISSSNFVMVAAGYTFSILRVLLQVTIF